MVSMNDYYLSKQLIAQSFTRAADRYDSAAILQRQVGEQLLERLQFIKLEPTRILDIGCGTGLLTQQLQRKYSAAQTIALDIAHGMTIYAKEKHIEPNLFFVCGDTTQIPLPTQSVDLIFSNFTLHWCDDLNAVFAECQRILKPGGLMLFTMLGPSTLTELRQSWAQVDDFKHVHAFFDMHDIGDCMLRNQFHDPVMDIDPYVLTYTNVFGLMRDLKDIGAHNLSAGRRLGLTGKEALHSMIRAYERRRTAEGTLPATYEVIFGHAWGGVLKNKKSASRSEIRIPLDQIRSRKEG